MIRLPAFLQSQRARKSTLSVFRFPLLVVVLIFLAATPLRSQTPSSAETIAFNAAARAFNAPDYDLARREFADFVRKYPQSAKVPEALLLQAQAALKLGDTTAAASLLSTNLPQAGGFTEQYLYLLGASHLQATNYPAAISAFSRVLADFPRSARVVEASYGQALAHYRLNQTGRVLELLQNPNGAFQKNAPLRTNDVSAVRGFLLLSEVLMQQNQLADAERTLLKVRPAELTGGDLLWDREFLLCRIQMRQRRFAEALGGASNLVSIATSAGLSLRRADSVSLQAALLQQLTNFTAAAQVYEQNIRKDLPPEVRRQAFVNIVNFTLTEDTDRAIPRLERLIAEHADENGVDVARLGLGELRFKQYFALTTTNQPATNFLVAAIAQFDEIIRIPGTPLAGKAQLNRGWCLWEQGRTNESAAAFKAAIDQLPRSADRAVATFKLGDCLFARRDFSNAVENFEAVIGQYSDLEDVRKGLLPNAWYNVLRCRIELNDLIGANHAMAEILRSHADSPFAETGMLLVGQEWSGKRHPVDARRIFSDFIKRFPGSTLLPDVELALARTYEREQAWPQAIDRYDQWIDRHATNDLRPRAEFDRALAHYRAQRETNAANLFTNFLAQYPTDKLTPLVRSWIADYYFRQNDYTNAEANYQLVFLNSSFPVTELTWQARMMAGRAAYARQGYRDAIKYFVDLVNDNSCPLHLQAEAFYALGDSFRNQETPAGKSGLDKFKDAKEAYKKIVDLYPTNDIVPRAWGSMGDCYLQMSFFDTRYFTDALAAYQTAITNVKADITVRSLAEIGIATVLEAQARQLSAADAEQLFRSALDHYSAVVFGNNLNAANNEKVDLYYFKTAGLSGARLAEDRKQWQLAVNLYREIADKIPSLRPAMERRIERVSEQINR